MALKGSRELRARIRSLSKIPKPIGREWADETVRLAKSRVRVKTGRTKRSIRRLTISQSKATVMAAYGARYLDTGTTPHAITVKRFDVLKWNSAGQPLFAKRVRHPGSRRQPFLRESARDALKGRNMTKAVVEEWNKAA